MKHGFLLFALAALLLAPAPALGRVPAVPVPDGEDIPGTASDEADESEEAAYTLSRAYPNPFHTFTRFDLRVEESQQVSVEVYNLLGQRVRTLYEGTVEADQPRTFTFRANALPSGLYLYRVRGETFTAARRVTLVQ